METRLQQLFDLQYFMQNSRLQNVINDVLVRYRLSDETGSIRSELEENDLEMLYAAGDIHAAAGSLRTVTGGIMSDKQNDTAKSSPLGCMEHLIPGDFR